MRRLLYHIGCRRREGEEKKKERAGKIFLSLSLSLFIRTHVVYRWCVFLLWLWSLSTCLGAVPVHSGFYFSFSFHPKVMVCLPEETRRSLASCTPGGYKPSIRKKNRRLGGEEEKKIKPKSNRPFFSFLSFALQSYFYCLFIRFSGKISFFKTFCLHLFCHRSGFGFGQPGEPNWLSWIRRKAIHHLDLDDREWAAAGVCVRG